MKRNGGFSLVELMVAMVIGLIIILGAGQLFLTVFQTNRQVMTLSEKQATVSFAVESLLRDIRRADPDSIVWDDDDDKTLILAVPNRGDIVSGCDPGDSIEKAYKLSELAVSEQVGWAIEMRQSCDGSEPPFEQIVAAFAEGGFEVDDSESSEGIWIVTLELIATGGNGGAIDSLEFYAVNRTSAVAE